MRNEDWGAGQRIYTDYDTNSRPAVVGGETTIGVQDLPEEQHQAGIGFAKPPPRSEFDGLGGGRQRTRSASARDFHSPAQLTVDSPLICCSRWKWSHSEKKVRT